MRVYVLTQLAYHDIAEQYGDEITEYTDVNVRTIGVYDSREKAQNKREAMVNKRKEQGRDADYFYTVRAFNVS